MPTRLLGGRKSLARLLDVRDNTMLSPSRRRGYMTSIVDVAEFDEADGTIGYGKIL